MALSRQPLAQTGINASPSEMGTVQGKRTVFSTHLCMGGQQWPTQSQPRHFQSGALRQSCCLHPSGAPTTSPCLVKSLQEVTSQRGKFQPDISGYFRERVKICSQVFFCELLVSVIQFQPNRFIKSFIQPQCCSMHQETSNTSLEYT